MKYYYLHRHPGLFYYYQHRQKRYGFRTTWIDHAHKRHEKSKRGFPDVSTALRSKRKAEQRQSALQNDDLTFAQWCQVVLRYIKQNRKISTYKSYEIMLTHNVIPYLGNEKLIDIKPLTYKFKCLAPLMNKGLSHKTILNVNSRVQAVMNRAVDNQLIKRNPLNHIEIPKIHVNPQRVIMTKRQHNMFTRCLKKQSMREQVGFTVLEQTGMRAGELLALQWRDIRFDRRLLCISHTRDAYGRRSAKTAHSNRKMIIGTKLNIMLYRYYQQCKKRYSVKPDSYILLSRTGRPLSPNMVSIDLKHILILSGLHKLVGRFTPHSFRHMFASQLISHGVNYITVSHILGHANPDITMRVYAQAAPNSVPDISRILSNIKSSTTP